jgi:hypothetical protein
MTGLPWVPLDSIQYRPGGSEVPHAEFKAAHAALLLQDQWIVDGFGSMDTVWERLNVADTLVYLDMPVWRHYWWVTKAIFDRPLGASCRLAGGELVIERDAEVLSHRPVVPCQTNPEISRVCRASEGDQAGLPSAIAPRHRPVLPHHRHANGRELTRC